MTDVTARAAALPTAALSDALDALGLPGSVHGLAPLAAATVAGPAFTVSYEESDGGSVGDFLDDVPAGAVVVIDNDGRTDCTVWGGIMTKVASSRGVAGTVVHGVCRDVATSFDLGYPIFSRGRFMRTGKDRVRLVATGRPLRIGGVEIRPGDLVRGDADGIVVVTIERAAEVVELAERIEAVERSIVDAVLGGSTLGAARAEYGYHLLQRDRS